MARHALVRVMCCGMHSSMQILICLDSKRKSGLVMNLQNAVKCRRHRPRLDAAPAVGSVAVAARRSTLHIKNRGTQMRLLFQRKAVRIQALTQQQWRALMTQQCDCNCKDSKNELSIEIIKAKRNSMPACWGAGITNSGTLIFLIPERSVLKNRYVTTNRKKFFHDYVPVAQGMRFATALQKRATTDTYKAIAGPEAGWRAF